MIATSKEIKKEIEDTLNRLEYSRQARDKTQEQWANDLDVSRQTYISWLQGHKVPSLENWLKIKDKLEG